MARRPRRGNGLAAADAARRGGPVDDVGARRPASVARDDQRRVAGARRRARAGRGHAVRARRPGRGRGGDHHATPTIPPPPSAWSPSSPTATSRRPSDRDDEPDLPELCALSWMVYSLPGAPVFDHHELGDAEYTLRSAVRSAADALGTIGLGSAASDIDDPRGLVEQLLESTRQHRIPDHAPSRALRVLENAAHVDAIIAVSAGLSRLPERLPQRAAPPAASPGSSRSGRNHRRKLRSPAMRCDRLPRWCARRGWPRSARSCTRPGPTNGVPAQRSAADGTARR